jgi:endonuclease/exonuclease/phosphatase family metal-dependent hydrolase
MPGIRFLTCLGALALWIGTAGCQAPTPPPARPAMLQTPVEVVRESEGVQAAPAKIRICTYNIQDFTDGIGEDLSRTPSVVQRHAANAAALLNEIKPDIVVIQEIENAEILKILNSHVKPPYPVGYITQFGAQGRNEKLNIAVLSRLDIVRARELDFEGMLEPAPDRPPRGALSFIVDLGDRHVLLVYGVHLKSNWGKREVNVQRRQRALNIVRAHAEVVMESNPESNWEVVVLGDMNTDPDAESFADDASLAPFSDWNDLWRGRPIEERTTIQTRRGDPALEFPPAAFDRIIASPSLSEKPWSAGAPKVLPKGSDTGNVFSVSGQTDLHVSDHYPVYVDLQK